MKKHIERNTVRWIVGIVTALAVSVATAVYGYGALNKQVEVNTKDIAEQRQAIKAIPAIDERTEAMKEQLNRWEDRLWPE